MSTDKIEDALYHLAMVIEPDDEGCTQYESIEEQEAAGVEAIAEARKSLDTAYLELFLDVIEQHTTTIHVSHVCPSDSIPCREWAAEGRLIHRLRDALTEKLNPSKEKL